MTLFAAALCELLKVSRVVAAQVDDDHHKISSLLGSILTPYFFVAKGSTAHTTEGNRLVEGKE